MAERRWTAEQLSAIETRDKTLLVSAAAGSGKTATLTERIIRSLTDREHPTTIDSMLIVTYTNAAANELREKIRVALEGAVKEHPEDEGLLRQLMMLPSARIKTIDSFCNDVLKANATAVGLSPRYRISTGAECDILAASIIDGLIDSVYSGDEPDIATAEEFDRLAECLTESRRTERLSDVLKYIYDVAETSLEGVGILRRHADVYDPKCFTTVEKSPHGAYLMGRLHLMAEHYLNALLRYRRELLSDDLGPVYLPTVESDIALMQALLSCKDYETARVAVEKLCFSSIIKQKKKSPVMEDYFDFRTKMREDLKSYKKLFLYSTEEFCELYASLYEIFGTLCKFLFAFDGIFSEEKRQRGIVSYHDLERYTYKALWDGDERSEVAKSLSASFSQIYIDEYQDVNALQDKIFEAVSTPKNRFMVGDIKQSIYGFRSARPEIFASMKAAYPPLSESVGDTATIFMSSNFRCDKGIVDFTNEIFDKMFGLFHESIGYQEGDRLGYAKIQKTEPPYRRPSVIITENKKYSDGMPLTNTELVARKIHELISTDTLNSGEPIKPSDIAIILRGNGKIADYAEALEKYSIKVEIAAGERFFGTPEVLLTLSLLHAIDNPKRDIYLAALMCSPLFAFDGTELAKYRSDSTDEPLYDSLLRAAADGNDKKLVRFLDTLNRYRDASEGMPVDRLIYRLYHETGLLALASRQGGRKNLMLLYDHARSFEAGAFKGLYNFLTYIDNVISGKEKSEFDEKRAGDDPNAVKIMTAHSSKGLEYPIVFFAGAESRLHSGGTKDGPERWVRYSEELGIAVKLRTEEGNVRINNPVNEAINEFSKDKEFEEELRVLYVILTRARERLYVVGESPKKDIDDYKNHLRIVSENLSQYSAMKLGTYLDIIIASVGGGEVVTERREEASLLNADIDALGASKQAEFDELIKRLNAEEQADFDKPIKQINAEERADFDKPIKQLNAEEQADFDELVKQLDATEQTGRGDTESAEKAINSEGLAEQMSFDDDAENQVESDAKTEGFNLAGSTDGQEKSDETTREIDSEEDAERQARYDELARELTERFTFEYAEKLMTVLPEKLSVSALTPTVFDSAYDSAVELSFGAHDEALQPDDENLNGENLGKMQENVNLGLQNSAKNEKFALDDSKEIFENAKESEHFSDGAIDGAPAEKLQDRKNTLPKFMEGSPAEESAKRGIATHYFMQFCNLGRFATDGSRRELDRLVTEGFISKADGERVRVRELEAFRRSALLRNMLGATEIYRELRFNLYMPAALFTEDEEKREFYSDRKVLVQGVIDCIYRDEHGGLHLVDYKTDRLTREERENRALAEKKMRDAHSLQLSYYALAIKEMFGAEVESISVYSLQLGDEIKIFNVLDKK